MTGAVLDARGLVKTFTAGRDWLGRPTERVQAVSDVSVRLAPGETLGLVGESGSGKSTTGRLLLRLVEPDAGSIELLGRPFHELPRRQLREARRDIQMVFQDPYASLDPSWTVADLVGEPLIVHTSMPRRERESATRDLLDQVGLLGGHLQRYAYEFSGGQRQRIAIARALALNPKVLVCDEPVSALDVSTQAQVISLFEDLREQRGLSYLFIAHDLAVVRHISHRIAVMYLGHVVEEGPAEEVYERPRHPYTQALLSAIPVPDPRRQRARQRTVLSGDVPSASNPPPGCVFSTRCPYAFEPCGVERPPLVEVSPGVSAACHLHDRGPRLAGAPLTSTSAPAGSGT